MNNKLIALVALIVSGVALLSSVAFLIYNIVGGLPVGHSIFLIVAVVLIALLCVINYIYIKSASSDNDLSDK